MTDPARYREWTEIDLPFPPQHLTRRSGKNLTMLKSMLSQDNLINGQDYIIMLDPLYRNFKLRFRDPDHTSWYLMKWVTSNWFNQQ